MPWKRVPQRTMISLEMSICIALMFAMILLQAGRMNICADYDSLHYGLRNEYVLDNRLNNAMKYLTSITLLMAVPTVISGLYGMNVQSDGMPFANTTAGFAIVLGLTLALCVFSAWVLHKKHML